jgi:heavy metal sensor kinase
LRVRPTDIRYQLTLWYVAIFSLVLALYIAGACFLQYWQSSDQLYHAEVQDLETVEGLLYFARDGRLLLHEDYHSRPESRYLLNRLMEVLDANGRVLFRNEKLNGAELGGTPVENEVSTGYFARRLRLSDGRRVLAVSHVHWFHGQRLLLRVAYSTEPLRVHLGEFFGLLVLAMPIALVAAGFAGYRVAGKALNPLEEMARLTEQITARRLSDRIPAKNPDDELGHMARVLNGLLERLEESFKKLEQFTSDVTHELRTPMASIRSVGEVGLQQQHTPEEYRDIIGSMLEEVARLTSMIDMLLTIAHAESGAIALDRTVFPLKELVEESVAVVGVLAEDRCQTILVACCEEVAVQADRGFLRLAVINLLDNAVKYSPQGSTIRLSLNVSGKQTKAPRVVKLAIADEGPGIPASEMHRIFDRFYRVDAGRAREAGGAGLGLAIAKWAVEAQGGQITVESKSGKGSVFTLSLPVVETAQTLSGIPHDRVSATTLETSPVQSITGA